jgi:hypothetical protein
MPFAKLYIDCMKINTLHLPTSFNDIKSYMKCFNELDNNFKETCINFNNVIYELQWFSEKK